MTHCSACRRRIRVKRVPGGIGGNYSNPVATGYTDWLGHSKAPMCSRYGQSPDALGRDERALMLSIRDHGAAIEVVRSKADLETFRRLEALELVRWSRMWRSASLHSHPYDATFLTDKGRNVLRGAADLSSR